MNDALIKGTGNSRYLKSVENFLTLYPSYEAFASALVAGTLPVDFNGINTAGWHQLGTALNKANLLRDTTAAQFGLGVDAVPNDILSFVGKYNEHWWSLLHGEAYSYYQEKQALNTKNVAVGSDSYYSKTISINQSNGTVSLVDPTKMAYAASQKAITTLMKTLCDNAPLYYQVGGTFFFIPAGATYDDTTWVGNDTTFSGWRNSGTDVSYVFVNASPDSSICARLVSTEIINVPAGAVTYEHSADRNAYPDSGTVDGITYQFLGVPFQKFPGALRAETGTYVGTGTYGEDHPNSLTFSIRPIALLVYTNGRSGLLVATEPFDSYAVGYVPNNPGNCAISLAGNTLSWYAGGANDQCNVKTTTYHYIAIGY